LALGFKRNKIYNKPMKDLKEKLSKEAFEVTQNQGTERPFSGDLLNIKEEGTYKCICCGQNLFSSQAKFESGTGWPSFFMPIDETAVKNIEDRSHGMVRVEVRCNGCDAHLGHVFPDGPEPTGLRYCMNSVAMSFEPYNSE
jgi:peptide-methionine (R)-S-oxide reductase|tara:strand:+ start:2983 stop:3405 length:423 start_codon:yes stop_codon:yes gene_type:complete